MAKELNREMFEPVARKEANKETHQQPSLSFWQDAWRRLKQNKLAMTGLGVIIFLLIMSIIGPWINEYSYEQQHLALKNQAPNSNFWFGTDTFGRDLFTRTWYGARISLFIGIAAAFIDLVIGIIWGGIAGYYGGK